jgi:hypothetical protein
VAESVAVDLQWRAARVAAAAVAAAALPLESNADGLSRAAAEPWCLRAATWLLLVKVESAGGVGGCAAAAAVAAAVAVAALPS